MFMPILLAGVDRRLASDPTTFPLADMP